MEDIKTVVTVSGKTFPKKECRTIRGEFYKIGDVNIENSGDCYKINDKYYKQHTGYIYFDNRIKKYIIKDKSLMVVKGVIGFDKSNNPIFGSFSKKYEKEDLVLVHIDGNTYQCFDNEIFKGTIYKEQLSSGNYYNKYSLDTIEFTDIKHCDLNYKNTLSYDSKGKTNSASEYYHSNYSPKYTEAVKKYGDVAKGLTFGLEFETVKGMVPPRIVKNLGLIPLRDGSVKGLEYVTIPLEGKKGVQTIVDTVKQLKKRTLYDETCALHLHIGNIPRTEEFFIAAFRVLTVIQDSIFELFPLYKKYNYGVKRKHYTKPLPINSTILKMDGVIDNKNIKKNFEVLYSFLSMGRSYQNEGGDLSNIHSHPSDPEGTSKWNIKTRYYWVNLIPLLFGNKQTIEFRIHTPTYDINKIMNYFIVCTSIVNFIKNNQNSILSSTNFCSKINFNNILYKEIKNPRLVENVLDYIDSRNKYIYNQTCSGDLVGNEEEFNPTVYINWNRYSSDKKVNPYDYYIRKVNKSIGGFTLDNYPNIPPQPIVVDDIIEEED